MKFDHMVSYRGVYYKAGEEVPIEEKQPEPPVREEVVAEPEEQKEVASPRRRGRPSRRE